MSLLTSQVASLNTLAKLGMKHFSKSVVRFTNKEKELQWVIAYLPS